jgi:hypothetical protein
MPTLYLTQVVPTDLPAEADTPHKSTGPRTPEGRRRSSLNARRHQLTAKVYIAPPDEMEAYDAHCKSFHAALAPVGTLEGEACAEISSLKWRLKRAEALENAIFAQGFRKYAPTFESGDDLVDGALAEGQTWLEHAHSLTLLTTYEQRIRRALEKVTAELEKLQQARKAAYAEAQEEAIRLLKLSLAKSETYDPASDFLPASEHGEFVYAPDSTLRLIDRRTRLEEARTRVG